jgi:hypothetical protein
MPTFTYEDAQKPDAKSFSFEEAQKAEPKSFSFEDAQHPGTDEADATSRINRVSQAQDVGRRNVSIGESQEGLGQAVKEGVPAIQRAAQWIKEQTVDPLSRTADRMGLNTPPPLPKGQTLLGVTDAGNPLMQGVDEVATGLYRSLTPANAAQIATMIAAPESAAAKTIGAKFTAQMAADAPEHAAAFGKAIGEGDTKGATAALLNYAVSLTPAAGVVHKGVPENTARTLARAIKKAPLAMAAVKDGATLQPLTAKAVVDQIVKKGVPDARPIPISESTTQREVRPPVGETPPLRQPGQTDEVQKPRSQAQTEAAKGLVPAIKQADGTIIPGKPGQIHNEIIADQVKQGVLADGDRVFVDKQGNVLTREQAAKAVGETDPLHSETLNKINAEKAAPAPAVVAPVPTSGEAVPPAEVPPDEAPKATVAPEPKVESKTPEPPGGIISMGGLAPGDPGEPVGKGGSGNPDIYGVAERVREERARAGQVGEVPPGEGISAPDSVEHGRELLRSGADPEKVLSAFEKTKRLSSDDMAVVRAKGEELAKAARRIEEKFGTHSPEYKMAWDALSAWDARSKAMQTEWHKTGQAQQGETDIDTGTFTGLARAFKNDTGKDFTPVQEKKAKEIAKENTKAETDEAIAKDKLFKEADKPLEPKVKSLVERILAASHTQADAARARLKARAFTFSAGLDPTVLSDVAIIGADHILTGAIEFGEWSKRMIEEFGEKIEPHLKEIFEASDKRADEITNKMAGDDAPKVKAARKPSTPLTVEESRRVLEGHKKGTPFTPEQVKALWDRARGYLNQGASDFDDIRSNVATDMGLSVNEVTRGLTQSAKLKRMADDVWLKQKRVRQLREGAKRWLKDQATPGFLRALKSVPDFLFANKVRFHGTVALGTHAPMLAFQPQYWDTYARNYARMFRMAMPTKNSEIYHERQMQDLVRRPNFTLANRSGLVNDPFDYEEFDSPETVGHWKKLMNVGTESGKRGYAVLKTLRQDVFDQQWEALNDTSKTPEVAQALADGINHATGVVKARAPKGLNKVFFAPRLWASRAAWLTVDPAKAANTFSNWKTATDAEKIFAVHQLKEKATVLGTSMALLALNQGFLTATGSKQKINFTDPMKGDFMKFKAAGMQMSYGNQFLSMARLPLRLWAIHRSAGGKLKGVVYPDESAYTVVGEYARSQLSPFASLTADLYANADWMQRQLPSSHRPEPARLRKEGVNPYTWSEFVSEQALPIPAEEAIKEVWKTGFGMTPEQIRQAQKALATVAVMTATGARLNEDWTLAPKK